MVWMYCNITSWMIKMPFCAIHNNSKSSHFNAQIMLYTSSMLYLFLMQEDYTGHILYSRLLRNLSCWSDPGNLQIATQATLDVSVLADVELQAFCLWEEEGEAYTVVWEVDVALYNLRVLMDFLILEGLSIRSWGLLLCQAWSRGITFILPTLLYN